MTQHKLLLKTVSRLHIPMIALLIALAILLRVVIVALGWPTMNSDEGTMGIAAINIAYHHQYPVFFYGQSYMGTLEAYIGAIVFHIIGVSPFSLRIGLILLYAGFLLALYKLAKLLFTKTVALVSVALLCLGTPDTLLRQLFAVGGAMETLFFGTLAFLLASWLALTFKDEGSGKKRVWAYGALGLTVGLGVWSHMLVLPFVALAVFLVLLFCFKELWSMKSVVFVLGTIIGLLPLLIYDVQNPGQNALTVLLNLHSSGGLSQGTTTYSHANSILGTLLISIPAMTGAAPLFLFSSNPGQWREQLSAHVLFQGIWGLCFVVLLGSVFCLTAYRLVKRHDTLSSDDVEEKRRFRVRYLARLCLLGGAILTLLSYVISPAPALVPGTSSRYLVGLLIITPALIALPCSVLARYRISRKISWPSILSVVSLGFLSFVFIIYIYGTLAVFSQQIPGAQRWNQQQMAFINELQNRHIAHIYSDYWTCNRLIFQSDEHIICSVLGNNLRTGQNRYQPYHTIVSSDPHAAYVFLINSPQDKLLRSNIAMNKSIYQQNFELNGYNVYVP